MSDSEIQDRVMEAVVIMNAAMINLRLYPPTNAQIVNTIGKLHETLETLLAGQEPVTLAEWERSLLVCGEPLSQKNLERPQVAIILMLMATWGIKSLDFHRGLEKAELSFFLELISQKSGTTTKEAWWEQAAALDRLPHITINQKSLVDRRLDALGTDLSDEAITTLLTMARDPAAIAGLEKLRELAADDPGWLTRTLHTGVEQLVGRGDTAPPAELSAQLVRMLRSLDAIADPAGKEEISQQVAHELAGLDTGLIAEILQRNTAGLLDNRLIERIVEGMECGQVEALHSLLRQQAEADSTGQGANTPDAGSAREALKHLTATDKGAECRQAFEEKLDQDRQEREKRLTEIRERWQAFFTGLDTGQPEQEAAAALPGAVTGLLAEGEKAAADWLIGQLAQRLSNDRPAVRGSAAHILARLLAMLSEAQRTEFLGHHRDALLAWVASTELNDAYRIVGALLVGLAQEAVRADRLADSLPILEAFRHSLDRAGKTQGEAPSAAAELLNEIAAADILEALLVEFRTDRRGQRDAAGRHLVCLAQQTLRRLLDLLRDSNDSAERVLILNLIPGIGPAAIPSLVERLDPEAAWYDLRNLARLLGRVGGEAEARALAPLLGHSDLRVQREALKSIGGIGGARRGEILLAALPHCDDQIRASVVASLGSLKHRPAIGPLIDLFKAKTAMAAELKSDLEEKICQALGAIGDHEALPLLTEIGKSGGLFGFKSYPPKVKAAAARATALITGKG